MKIALLVIGKRSKERYIGDFARTASFKRIFRTQRLDGERTRPPLRKLVNQAIHDYRGVHAGGENHPKKGLTFKIHPTCLDTRLRPFVK